MVYDPNWTANSSLSNLVQGNITFLAGQVAKTGDMKVETPVATMGIRGTLVIVEIAANNGPTKILSVLAPTTGRVGEVVALDKNDHSIVLARTVSADNALVLTPGPNLQVLVTQVPVTAAEQQAAQVVTQQVVAIQAAFNAQPFIPGQPPAPAPTAPGDPGTGPSAPGGASGGGGGSGGTPPENLANSSATGGAPTTLVGTLTAPEPANPTIVVPTIPATTRRAAAVAPQKPPLRADRLRARRPC